MLNFFKKRSTRETEMGEHRRKFSQYIREFQADVEKLIAELSFTKLPGELLPPWLLKIYPLEIDDCEMNRLGIDTMTYIQKDSWYWYPDRVSGEGGHYKLDFDTYFNVLSISEKKSYFRKYDLGSNWKERERWIYVLFGDHCTDEELNEISKGVLDDT